MTFDPTPEQLAIIGYPLAPLRVAAGAGTGKTTTIVHRLSALVDDGLAAASDRSVVSTRLRAALRCSACRSVVSSPAIEVPPPEHDTGTRWRGSEFQVHRVPGMQPHPGCGHRSGQCALKQHVFPPPAFPRLCQA